ncbi:MAG: S-methyl-5'-thioadenosine phosphorylase [Phototrophicales bacterium]|nr:MAG: S-methyl-5'-thioadenosine phosphorylase [Phototrophicales bacterium]RMG71522.1 MAG: S-methyl-5'-thioadenosine phosphorylase [Chloroflexota bacterium]
MQDVKIAVIGGSGLYNMPEITNKETLQISTPYGEPSSEIMVGTLHGKRVAFLARHGAGHIYTPSTVPYRANIYALKSLGVRFIISVSACGSLREDYAPGHIVIPDQLYDNTKLDRGRTFFETGLVAHVGVAEPFCPEFNQQLYEAIKQVGGTAHHGGTFITIEGPRFSTKGESHIFRQWGCSIIGMTTSPEAYLAREAEIAYSVMAHVTDYDVWHETNEPVTVEMVMKTVQHNLNIIQRAIAVVVQNMDENAVYDCHNALQTAFMTNRQMIPDEILEKNKVIVGKYFD